ncbi:MAG: hypothetical protein WC384_10500 [Prolixibacteraceae bacterium]|jgi:rhodanese-related sulfurtransferase
MKRIKNILVVVLILLILLVLVISRSTDQNLFKRNVNSALEKSENGSNTISPDELKARTTAYLVINLDPGRISPSISVEKIIAIPLQNLLDEANRKILKEVDGDLILYSSENATSAKAWVILNQLGFQNVYILSSGENPEVLKYKFQPDTTARLEQTSD